MESVENIQDYLRSTAVVNWDTPKIKELAQSFSSGNCHTEIARRCFLYVRDEISHSFDADVCSVVTCSASQTLKERTGICYAKTHLLAAVLRANSIPAGFGYQRIALDDEGTKFCLHGFNFVYLEEFGWYAIDPRGNREGISTDFDPPKIHLAFPIRLPGEQTYETVFTEPLSCTVTSLQTAPSVAALRDALPDWDLTRSS